MATLEELVVSLVAETSGLRAELDKATKATQNATEKMDKAISEFSTNSSKNVGFFQTAMATATGFLGSQAVLGAFSAVKDAASFLFQELVVNGVAASSATETAITKLNTALAMTGQYSKTTSQAMVDLASELQATTVYGDDAVLSASALLQTIGKLGAKELPQATRATVDLAAALGIDLDSAAKLVGKAANGNVDAFSRYGLTIEKGTTASQTFANTLRTLSTFQGTASSQAKTFAGQTTILFHSWEDFTKVIGNAIIQNQAILNVLGMVNTLLVGETKSVEENENAFKLLIANGLIYLLDTLVVVTASIDVLIRAFNFLSGIVGALTLPLQLITAAFAFMSGGADAAKDVLGSWADTVQAKLSSFGESGDGVLSKMTESFAQMGNAAREGLDQIANNAETSIEPINNTTAAVVELSEAEKKRVENLTAFAQGLADQNTSIEDNYNYQLELLTNAREAEALTDEEFFAAKMEVMTAQQEAELALLDQYHKLKGSNDKTYADAKNQLLKKQTLDGAKFQKEQLEFEKLTAKEKEANLKSSLSTIATLSQSGNRTLAAIGKAAAISTATIDGYAAVQKALASAPPPFNFALAAAVGVATAANIAKISGVALNKGGTVPGGGPNSDSVPAMLTPGEEVVNRDTANQLRQFLNDQGTGGGSSSMRIEISLKDDLVEFIEAKIIERQRTGRSLLEGV